MEGGSVIYWPQGGGTEVSTTLNFGANGNWSFNISGTPGTTYNIIVQVTFTNQQTFTSATVSPDPATAPAAP
jgi:hypothetical protein